MPPQEGQFAARIFLMRQFPVELVLWSAVLLDSENEQAPDCTENVFLMPLARPRFFEVGNSKDSMLTARILETCDSSNEIRSADKARSLLQEQETDAIEACQSPSNPFPERCPGRNFAYKTYLTNARQNNRKHQQSILSRLETGLNEIHSDRRRENKNGKVWLANSTLDSNIHRVLTDGVWRRQLERDLETGSHLVTSLQNRIGVCKTNFLMQTDPVDAMFGVVSERMFSASQDLY